MVCERRCDNILGQDQFTHVLKSFIPVRNIWPIKEAEFFFIFAWKIVNFTRLGRKRIHYFLGGFHA